jgi:arylsulfatase A-like enzyme
VLLAAIVLVLATVVGPSPASPRQEQESPPNVVVILTDDEPYLDGRLIEFMPNTKQLFETQGIAFTEFRSQTPRCCPARATLLTGLRSSHHRVVDNDAALFDPSESLALALDRIGYHTMLVGKYMNGYGGCQGVNCAPNVPPGWNDFAGFGDPSYYKYDVWVNGVKERYGQKAEHYSTDVIASKADAMIRSAPTGDPLFAVIAPNAPHPPATPAPRYARTRCPSGKWKPPSWNEADVSDKPAYVQALPLLPEKESATLKPCRTLLAVDDLVGRVRTALLETGRLDNTLLVYTADNGVLRGEHRLLGKVAPYETRVAFYVSWPSRYQPGTVAAHIENTDFAPTICELTGCVLHDFPTGQAGPDGMSFLHLLSDHGGSMPRDVIYEELPVAAKGVPAWQALRTTDRRWHYVEYETGEVELYELTVDPWELENKAPDPEYVDVVATLRDRLELERGSAPNAVDDTFPATEDQQLDLPVSGAGSPTENDTDLNGDELTVTAVANAVGGGVSIVGQEIRFAPAPDACGAGSAGFDYTVSDGTDGSDEGHVTLDVACLNDPPVASDDGVSGTRDTELVLPVSGEGSPAANDSDVDGDALAVAAVGGETGGSISIVDAEIRFQPEAELCGEGAAGFDYTVTDGQGGSDDGRVTIDLACTHGSAERRSGV